MVNEICEELISEWNACLMPQSYALTTIDAKLSALNGLLEFRTLGTGKVLQDPASHILECWPGTDKGWLPASSVYSLHTAYKLGWERLGLSAETIDGTGIWVNEVRSIIVETVLRGKTEISLKEKIRTVLMLERLYRKLLKYAKNRNPLPVRSFAPKAERSYGAVKSGRNWKNCADMRA